LLEKSKYLAMTEGTLMISSFLSVPPLSMSITPKRVLLHHRRHGIRSQISPQALRGLQWRAKVFIVVVMVTYRYAPVSMTKTRPEWGPTAVMSVGEYRLLSAILGMDCIHVWQPVGKAGKVRPDKKLIKL
jgi:hypothetical protein